MIFSEPLPFDEALDRARKRELFPTVLSSREISELGQDILDRSVLSARTNSLSYLQDVKEAVEAILGGDLDMASARLRLQKKLADLQYDPLSGGFAGEEAVEPAETGSLRDLSSERRTQLLLETQVRQATGYADWKSGQSDYALHAFPALELVRIYPRVEARDWLRRWEKAGGVPIEVDGKKRMMARKDDDVWVNLGSRSLFSDALGQPYSPFAFGSGMGTRAVARKDALAWGVIGAKTDIQGARRSFNTGVEVAAKFDPEFLKSLKAGLDLEVEAGRARLRAANPESRVLRNRLRSLLGVLERTAA